MILDIITATIHVLHAHLAAPTASFCCVSCWSLTCLGQSFFQVLDRAKSNQRLAHAVARCRIRICVQAANVCAAEFASACRLPMSALLNSVTALVLVNLSPWRVLLPGLDIPSSSPCSSTICAADFPLTNLQLHKYALPIYAPVSMAASTPRHCFRQPVEVCTSCTFDTVSNDPHQKNPTPSSDRFKVPLHRICSSSQSMFLPQNL